MTTSAASLEWDPNTEPDITGYKLHYGTTSGTYLRILDAGKATTATLPTLISGFTYYFAVTAYNAAGLESLPSNEVTFTVPWPAGLQLTYLPRDPVAPPPNAPLQCGPVQNRPNGGFAFLVTAAEQTAVTVYASSDLATWEVQGTVTNPTGRLLIRDTGSAALGRRFYRVAPAEIDKVVN